MDTKSLRSRQVYWAQELFCYHSQIDYRQDQANGAANALSRYPQRSAEEEDTFQAKNVKILHCLQSLLAKVSGLLANSSYLSPLHQVLIYGTHGFPQLNQFGDSLRSDIAHDSPYASIGVMNLRLPKLYDNDKKAKVLRAGGLPEGWKEVERVL